MKEALLTVGPRASGKTTFCKKAVELDPSIIFISRDEISVSLFGKTSFGTYKGEHLVVLKEMFEKIKKAAESSSDLTMILDCFNGNTQERKIIIHKLREYGFEVVKAWQFITEPKYVKKWFWGKPKIAKSSEMTEKMGKGFVFYSDDAPIKDYNLFSTLVTTIGSDGFDKIIKIDPLITNVEEVLKLKAGLK